MRLFGVIPVPPIGRILKSRWLRVPLIVLGVLCIFAAIWFGFPMTGWGPLISPWTRGGVIGAILFVIGLVYFLRWRKRRKAAQALEENLIPEPVGDGKVLAERMEEALTKLKKAGGKTYLYDLPWYIIIGPPGAGKTTALRNSGLEFPGLDDLPDAGHGFGGTRNCDWWFAEEAVLIDTAGRYTTQDSDAEADRASWTAFLDILKRGRANQPINGVILAFSTEDMMQSDAAQLAEQAAVGRQRRGPLCGQAEHVAQDRAQVRVDLAPGGAGRVGWHGCLRGHEYRSVAGKLAVALTPRLRAGKKGPGPAF